ncbi:NADP-dependent alcohol dehydrogenase [Dendrothele bispora CBS 962.96]|uniref:NADP-dependent alcohol dehydrogenase n=1 Tax=Dendrothele bispora (strain CBS 962.96) TaxID=1314807 RepID=A0A4S8MQ13_DENBC|nr:NADP-dependent alcohol dehydrogenase [Dendrothele bispora CBS 962.96]
MSYKAIQFRGSSSGEVVQKTHVHEPPKPDEVVVRVTHSGLCGTDLHYIDHDVVLGHEGIGIVQEVGSACKDLKVGDRVGWGYPHSTCGSCDACLTGNESYCPNAEMYGEAAYDQGSLSSLVVRKEQWLFKIPDSMSSEDAAPFMCGGATVWTPLIDFAKPYDRIGIVGIGGLGHLAIQFAAKTGCDVVVFSGSDDKREEAMKLGAREFYATKGVTDYTSFGMKPIDRLFITTSAKLDLSLFYSILNPQATVLPLTVSGGDLTAPYLPTVLRGYKIVGSKLATRFMQKKMLEFADRNEIHAMVEKYPMTLESVTKALRRLQDGKMRYRGVVSWEYQSEPNGYIGKQ